jgi:hypothetical protein
MNTALFRPHAWSARLVTSFEWHLRLPSSGPVSRTGPLGLIRYGNVTKSSRNARADGVSTR